MADPSLVLIDTDVFSALYTSPDRAASRGLPVHAWRAALSGKRVVISFQTRAEVLAGFRAVGWGERRIGEAQSKLDSAPTVGVDERVIQAFAALTAGCRLAGHPLHQKIHTGDRWVAASAIAHDLPLLSGDHIYVGVPLLALAEANR